MQLPLLSDLSLQSTKWKSILDPIIAAFSSQNPVLSIIGNPISALTSSLTQVNWLPASIKVDTANAWTQNTYKIPMAGYYLASFSAQAGGLSSAGNALILNIKQNNNVIAQGEGQVIATNNACNSTPAIVIINALQNDVITFFASYTASGASWNAATGFVTANIGFLQ